LISNQIKQNSEYLNQSDYEFEYNTRDCFGMKKFLTKTFRGIFTEILNHPHPFHVHSTESQHDFHDNSEDVNLY